VKVILCERVANLGEMGDVVTVSNGYARNYLIPRKLAVSLDSATAKQVDHERRIIRKREEKLRLHLQEIAQKLEQLTVEIKARAGLEEKLYGSVTAAQIAEQLRSHGYEIDHRQVLLDQPIKALGIYLVPVKLGRDVEAQVKVWVAPEEIVEEAVEGAAVAEQGTLKEVEE